MSTIEVVQLIIAILALIVSLGTYWHSRTNRRVVMKILQRRHGEARRILLDETGEKPETFLPFD